MLDTKPQIEKEFLRRKLLEFGDENEKHHHRLTDFQTHTILLSLSRSIPSGRLSPSTANLINRLKEDFFIFKVPLYREIDYILEGKIPAPPEVKRWATEIAEDYVGCSAVSFTTRQVYDCIIDRIEKRIGLKEKISEIYDFDPKEILRRMMYR